MHVPVSLEATRSGWRSRVVALILMSCIGLGVLASVSGAGVSRNDTKRYNVTLVTAGVQLGGYQVAKCYAMATAKKLNINLKWTGTTGYTVADEMNVFESALASKPDGLILIPWNSNAFVAPVQKLMSEGIPVVTADGSLSKHVDVANVRTNNLAVGRLAAGPMGSALGGKGTIAIFTDTPANIVQNQRWQGFLQTLRKEYPNIKALPVQYVGSGGAEKAASVAASILSAHPELSAFYSTINTTGVAIGSAIAAAHKTGKVLNISWDPDASSLPSLKNGRIDGMVAQDWPKEGQLMVETINTALRHPSVKIPYNIYTGGKYITKDNYMLKANQNYIYIPRC